MLMNTTLKVASCLNIPTSIGAAIGLCSIIHFQRTVQRSPSTVQLNCTQRRILWIDHVMLCSQVAMVTPQAMAYMCTIVDCCDVSAARGDFNSLSAKLLYIDMRLCIHKVLGNQGMSATFLGFIGHMSPSQSLIYICLSCCYFFTNVCPGKAYRLGKSKIIHVP